MLGPQSILRSNNAVSSGHLVEFRAGRMSMIGQMVHPDPRKGLVYMTKGDDGLTHFCWKDRTTGKVEHDLIVYPGEFEFKLVEQCKNDRVYVLKFKSSRRRMFFWMQEPNYAKYEVYCRRVNELLERPPSGVRFSDAEGSEGMATDTSHRKDTATSQLTAKAYLSSALAKTIKEAINQLISNPECVKTLYMLLPKTEDGDDDKKKQIMDNITSPQFEEALSLFVTALQAAKMGPVLAQFELTPDAVAAAYTGNLEEFFKALQKSVPDMPKGDQHASKDAEKKNEAEKKE